MTQHNVPATRTPPEVVIGAKGLEAKNIEQLFRVADAAVKANLAPRGMNAQQAFGCMAYGLELGYTPLRSLQAIAMVNGKPTQYADAITSLLLESGQLEDAPKETYTGEGESRKCVVELRRKGFATAFKGEFSIAQAKQAGLLQKGGPWRQYPDRMLFWRAFGWAARKGFADILQGLWTREEAEDMGREVVVTEADLPEVKEVPFELPAQQAPQAPVDVTADLHPEDPDKAALWRAWETIRSQLTAEQIEAVKFEVGQDITTAMDTTALDVAVEFAERLIGKGAA